MAKVLKNRRVRRGGKFQQVNVARSRLYVTLQTGRGQGQFWSFAPNRAATTVTIEVK